MVPRLPPETFIASENIPANWETSLLPDHLYIDEAGRRFVSFAVESGLSEEEEGAAAREHVTRFFPIENGRSIWRGRRIVTRPDGSESVRHLFEAPAIIDTSRFENRWYLDLRPGRVYVDDSERAYIVSEVDLEPGLSPHGLASDVQASTEHTLGRRLVLLGERRFPGATGMDSSSVRYLFAERIVDDEGHPIDPEVREREAMAEAWRASHEE